MLIQIVIIQIALIVRENIRQAENAILTSEKSRYYLAEAATMRALCDKSRYRKTNENRVLS